jgi:predicted metal-dependent peptidase
VAGSEVTLYFNPDFWRRIDNLELAGVLVHESLHFVFRHGTIRSVEHTIQHLEELSANLEQTIADTRKRFTDTKVQVEAPFEYAEKLASLVQRQQEIEDALDLTKNQASSQLNAESSDSPHEDGTKSDSPSESPA